jgi:hypothetical protein
MKKELQISRVERAAGPANRRLTGFCGTPRSKGGAGSADSSGRPIRRKRSLSRGRASGGRRASRKSSDSGRLRITTGIMTADATAPNTNAERQPYPVMRTAAMVPPTVAPIG